MRFGKGTERRSTSSPSHSAERRARWATVGGPTSVVDAQMKSWGGQVTFAMAPTLSRASNLADMPALDLLVIDEAHHAASRTSGAGSAT